MIIDLKTLNNTKKVALAFFIATGLFHLASSMFIANSYYLKQSLIINRTMDIPFLLTGLIYALTSIRISLTDPNLDHKKLDIFLSSIIILALIVLIIINLAFENIK
ncbi:hypothetical protein COU74_04250 [Candidatus Peregrinibacteria bacterium CG10_big_fil_rev_8_21_14_0_10_36_19]|nr:MAG: hypothetical protein COU74_04250 [Candidatus Peregrinibacteria bacterium CG10_big_fil_rev_8_21_14_0_10_36_19]